MEAVKSLLGIGHKFREMDEFHAVLQEQGQMAVLPKEAVVQEPWEGKGEGHVMVEGLVSPYIAENFQAFAEARLLPAVNLSGKSVKMAEREAVITVAKEMAIVEIYRLNVMMLLRQWKLKQEHELERCLVDHVHMRKESALRQDIEELERCYQEFKHVDRVALFYFLSFKSLGEMGVNIAHHVEAHFESSKLKDIKGWSHHLKHIFAKKIHGLSLPTLEEYFAYKSKEINEQPALGDVASFFLRDIIPFNLKELKPDHFHFLFHHSERGNILHDLGNKRIELDLYIGGVAMAIEGKGSSNQQILDQFIAAVNFHTNQDKAYLTGQGLEADL